MSEYILPLSHASYKKIGLVGGKAASLGEMLQSDIPVPPGFVITTAAYKVGNLSRLGDEILKHFDQLGAELVAVRSSAVAEDSSNASWAGQLETVLNVSRGGLLKAVEHCWQSMQSQRAQSYAQEHRITKEDQAVAVVVQAMVKSDSAGVMFTANPTNNRLDESVIEAIYGLGEFLVQGLVTPESHILSNKTGEVISSTKHRQDKMLTYKDGGNREAAVTQTGPILKPAQLEIVMEQGRRIQDYYGQPQDIEFAFEGDQLFIVQSRPITTLQPS